MSSPKHGSDITIESYKHDLSFHRSWDKTTVLHVSDTVLIGANNNVKVTEADGREWRTREPAVCTFGRGQWFNTIAMIREDGTYYYCNIGSPFTLKGNVLSYIDYDLDVKVFPDMSYIILDLDEYAEHRVKMNYPLEVINQVEQALQDVTRWIKEKKGPFRPGFVDRWYERYLQFINGSSFL